MLCPVFTLLIEIYVLFFLLQETFFSFDDTTDKIYRLTALNLSFMSPGSRLYTLVLRSPSIWCFSSLRCTISAPAQSLCQYSPPWIPPTSVVPPWAASHLTSEPGILLFLMWVGGGGMVWYILLFCLSIMIVILKQQWPHASWASLAELNQQPTKFLL